MKILEIYKMQQELIKSKEDIAKSQIIKTFSSHVPEAVNISVNFDERYVVITYNIEIDGVWYANEKSIYDYTESLESCGLKSAEKWEYVRELRRKYPEYCKQNDYIQLHRQYKKDFKLDSGYNGTVFQLSGELCNLLKLPNTTSCGVGGGDNAIKHTPVRTKQFLSNIDICISKFEEYISELKTLKLGLQDIMEELNNEQDSINGPLD